MHKKQLIPGILALSLPICAQSAVPSVAVDIAPVHSLVSQIMEGVGEPTLLIPAEASPHGYALLPSQVQALSEANVVFWMGESFTPWLEKALDNVADSAQKIELLELEETVTYDYREMAVFDEHHDEDGHDEKDEHHDEGGHDEKDEHHDEDGHDEHGHDHDGIDPHAWLDPKNAKVWLTAIKQTLSIKDPENAATYQRNAEAAIASLDELLATTSKNVKDLGKIDFVVFHDAYQYFEKRFDIAAAAAISLGDAQDPSPARIESVRETVNKLRVTCVFSEPQYNPGIVNSVFDGSSISNVAVMDPLGASIPTGRDHYQILIKGLVSSLSECVK